MNDSALDARVRCVNRAHKFANELQPRLVAVFAPFIGEKIERVDGPLFAKVQKKVDEAGLLPNYGALCVYRVPDNCLKYTVKASETWHGMAHYHDVDVVVGEMQNGVLTSLSPAPQFRSDYSAAEVRAAREKYKELRRAADSARSALYPFGEHDR